MKKTTISVALFGTCLLLSFAFKGEAPLYKNLKVLPKSTTKAQMDSVMRHFTVALGVKCNFCHVFNPEQKAMDFASDANEHKAISRNMMKMTQRLNRKYFDIKNSKDLTASLEVTCYTCHNGKAHPARFAAAQPTGAQNRPATDTARRQQ